MAAEDEWADLCERYDLADRDMREALAIVTRKFSAIAARTSRENPTMEELDRLDAAREKRDTADNAMREFMRARFGVDG